MTIDTSNFNISSDYNMGVYGDLSTSDSTIMPVEDLGVPKPVINDSLAKSGKVSESNLPPEVYNQGIATPSLKFPTVVPKDIPGTVDPKVILHENLHMNGVKEFLLSPDQLFAREIMEKIVKKFPPEEQSQAMLAFQAPHLVDPDSTISKAVKALADGVSAKFAAKSEASGEPLPSEKAGKSEKAEMYLALQAGMSFEQTIKGMDLSNKDMKKLIHAYAHPEDLSKLSPELQGIYKQAMDNVMQVLAASYGYIPKTELSHENMKTYLTDKKMHEDYDNGFEDALEEYAQKNGLSSEETATIKSMHYHPEADFPNSENLLKIRDKLESKIMGGLISEYGLPEDSKIASDKKTFDGIATGHYLNVFDQKLKNVNPPLSSSDMDTLMDAATGKGEKKLSPELKAVFDQVQQTALTTVRGELGMPSWVPAVGKAHPLASDPKTVKMLKSSIEMMENGLETAKNLAAQNPFTDHMRIDYGKYLMVVSAMMNLLKETIFTMTANDADISSMLAKGRYDTKMNQLLKQRIQIDNQREQIEKQESMSWMGPVMTAIVMIVCVMILGPTAGLIVGAIFAALMQTDALTKLFDAITKLVAMVCEALGLPESVTKIVTAIVKILVIIVLTILALPAGPMIMMMMFFMALSSSKAIDDIAMACGADKETAGYISMGVQIALMAVAMVVMAVNPGLITEMAAAVVPEAVMSVATMASEMVTSMSAQVTAYLTEVLGDVATMASEVINNVAAMASKVIGEAATEVIKGMIKALETFIASIKSAFSNNKGMMDALAVGVGVAEASIQLASSVQGVITHLKLHDLAMVAAELEQDVQVLEGVYKVIGTVQDNFQNAVVEGTSWAADVNKLQNEKWNKLSRAMTELFA